MAGPFDRIVGIDTDAQLPNEVRARLAANLGDASTPEGLQLTTSIGARPIVVLPGDPMPTLRENELIVQCVLPGNEYALNFLGDASGAPVSNLAKLSGTNWLVMESTTAAPGAVNARVLRIAGTNTFYAIPQVEADSYSADLDVLFRYRHSGSSQHGPQIYFYADETFTNGVYVAMNWLSESNMVARVRSKAGDTHSDLKADLLPPVATGAWLMMRARCSGNTVSLKVWPDGTAEPASWSVTWAVTTALPKQFAIGRTSDQGSQYIDWVAAATGGKVAIAP